MKTQGIHHISAMVGDPQENLDFYGTILGLRFVKKRSISMIQEHTTSILEMNPEHRERSSRSFRLKAWQKGK